MAEAIATRVADVLRLPDRIIEVRMREDVVVDVPAIEEILDAQVQLDRGEMTAVLIDARPVRTMSRQALERTANHPVNDRTASAAILVGNPVSVLLGNFFIRFTRPPYPTRLFRAEAPARSWLRDQLAARPLGEVR